MEGNIVEDTLREVRVLIDNRAEGVSNSGRFNNVVIKDVGVGSCLDPVWNRGLIRKERQEGIVIFSNTNLGSVEG